MVPGCGSLSDFASSVGILVNITGIAVGLMICAIKKSTSRKLGKSERSIIK